MNSLERLQVLLGAAGLGSEMGWEITSQRHARYGLIALMPELLAVVRAARPLTDKAIRVVTSNDVCGDESTDTCLHGKAEAMDEALEALNEKLKEVLDDTAVGGCMKRYLVTERPYIDEHSGVPGTMRGCKELPDDAKVLTREQIQNLLLRAMTLPYQSNYPRYDWIESRLRELFDKEEV